MFVVVVGVVLIVVFNSGLVCDAFFDGVGIIISSFQMYIKQYVSRYLFQPFHALII